MSQPATRGVFRMIITNFINSLKPRRFRGDLMGTDRFGTKYYEIPPNPSIGKSKASRWFVPIQKDDFEQEMPGEWESWLRGRRLEPPSEEELLRNYTAMQIKKQNAIEVDAKGGKMTPLQRGMESFPKRPDYEIAPGSKQQE